MTLSSTCYMLRGRWTSGTVLPFLNRIRCFRFENTVSRIISLDQFTMLFPKENRSLITGALYMLSIRKQHIFAFVPIVLQNTSLELYAFSHTFESNTI